MAIGDIYRLSATWRREANPRVCVNHFYFKQTVNLILDTPEEDLIGAFQEYGQDLYLALVTDFLVLENYAISQAPLFETFFVQDVAEPGTLTGEPLPPVTSLFIRTRTAVFNKKGRGGFFIPPAVESVNTNGKPTGSYVTSANNFMSALVNDMAADIVTYAGWTLQVWSPALGAGNTVTVYQPKTGWSHQVDRGFIY